MSSPSEKALTLVTKSEPAGSLLPKMPKLVAKKLDAIQRFEAKAAMIALQVGALLWRVKATVKHGEFKSWIETNIDGRGYRSCAYYMKLTLAFAEKSRVSEETFAALAGLNIDAKKQTGTNAEIASAVAKFVGDLSLNELLIKHGIKGVGLKEQLTGGDDNAPPALNAGEQMEMVWSQSFESAKSLAELIAANAASFDATKREALENELTRALKALRSA